MEVGERCQDKATDDGLDGIVRCRRRDCTKYETHGQRRGSDSRAAFGVVRDDELDKDSVEVRRDVWRGEQRKKCRGRRTRD